MREAMLVDQDMLQRRGGGQSVRFSSHRGAWLPEKRGASGTRCSLLSLTARSPLSVQ
jgi:hypothetical protein